MSVEILSHQERGAKSGTRRLASSLIASTRAYPTSWAIAWTALLLVLCLAPERLMPDEDSISFRKYLPHADLLVHFTLFAGFVAGWLRAGRSPLRWAAIPAVALLLAVGTEYVQSLPFIHRDASVLDGLADVFGGLLGLAGAAVLGRPSAATEGTAPGP